MAEANGTPAVPAGPAIIKHRTPARVGLVGNPSDQFNGKVVAFALANYYAEVALTPADAIQFVLHPEHDRRSFASLEDLVSTTSTQGFYGGERLLMAAVKVFADHCSAFGIELRPGGFELSYDTNIPRQLGLAGSSALTYSALKCLMEFYGVAGVIPASARPGLVLAAEQELGIAAGLQDRVIQVYGGVLYMDFDERVMAAHGGLGSYIRLNPELLPPLYLMYSKQPKESGKVHSTVKSRWLAGDLEVRAVMAHVAGCGKAGQQALAAHDHKRLGMIMDANFNLRRGLYGDALLGESNLRMAQLARSVGASVNFAGSGGCLVVYCPKGEPQAEQIAVLGAPEGFTVEECMLADEVEELLM